MSRRRRPIRRLLSSGLLACSLTACGSSTPSVTQQWFPAHAAAGAPGHEQAAETLSASPQSTTGAGSSQVVSEPLELAAEVSFFSPVEAGWREWVQKGEWSRVDEWFRNAKETDSRVLSYLRARAALEVGDYDRALDAYDRLGDVTWEARSLERVISQERQRALHRSSRFAEGTSELLRSRDIGELLLVAERWMDQEEWQRAYQLLDRAARLSPDRNEWAKLRALRARWGWARQHRYRAYLDWRWLVTKHPLDAEAAFALQQLETHFPEHPLTHSEWRQRVADYAEAGRPELVTEDLERWEGARVRPPSLAERLHYLGWAYYKKRDYPKASATLLAALEHPSGTSRHDRYYAARALSRQGRQLEAIAQYTKLLELSPKGRTQHLAAFRLAREYSLLGDWSQAVTHYSRFINRHPGSEFMETALRERAVARFATGEYERAAFELRRVRAVRPRSDLVGLYRHLEALALDRAGNRDAALSLWSDLQRDQPWSFEGMAALLRLRQMGQDVAVPVPPSLDSVGVELPPLVAELDDAGLFELAEDVLTDRERTLVDLGHRFQSSCLSHRQVFAGRRTLLLGLSAARTVGFLDHPEEAPRWVWDCLHPTPYDDWVRSWSARFQVPSSLVYSVMRQESGFRTKVVSPADARGLMQMIPPTAQEVAADLGEVTREGDLMNPHHNIRYGVYYLGKLLETFGRNPILAVAAYNAGPEAVGLWLSKGRTLPIEFFVARIPYQETQGYVRRVMTNWMGYQVLDPNVTNPQFPLEFGVP